MRTQEVQQPDRPLAPEATLRARPGRRILPLRPEHVLGSVVALAAFALYLRTLAPSVMPGDYAEFQMCAAILGVPHPTGYPLYVLLGKLFTLLPLGDAAYRVNLSSAVYMASAVGVLYALGVKTLRLLGLSRVWWAAGVGAALFAVAPTVWEMSLLARSYALNALLVSLVLFFLVSWRESRRTRWFFASCLVIGLSIVHHGTTYLLLPAYGLYLLRVEWERDRAREDARPWRRRSLGVAALAAGCSPILFLVYRFVVGSPYYWGNPTTWKDFFNLLTGGPFHNQVLGFGYDLAAQAGRAVFGTGQLSAQYTPLGIALGLLGLGVLWRARRWEAALVTLMLLGNFWFAMNYLLVGYLYFIPTYLLWALFKTAGVGWALSAAAQRLSTANMDRALRMEGAVLGAALLVCVVSLVVVRLPNIDKSGQTETRDTTLALLREAPPGASLFLDWEDVSVVRFYRRVYGMRPDLNLYTGDPEDWPKGIYCALTEGGSAYVGKFAGAAPARVARDFTLVIAPLGWRATAILNPRLYEVPPCGLCATCR